MSSKTPVSILQEMMAKQSNSPPRYDLIFDGSMTHEALFKYKVYACNTVASGSGRSKKEAKHEAAKNALKVLAQHQITSSMEETNLEGINIFSPYKDKVQDNAVGSLFDLCVMYEIPLPDYQHVREEGPPHERIFTCVCCISKIKETGVGRTKKQAKQLAASNMFYRLKETLGDMMPSKDVVDTTDGASIAAKSNPKDNLKEVINKYISIAGSPKRKVKLNDVPALYYRTLLALSDNIVSELESISVPLDFNDVAQDSSYWQNIVNSLAEKMEVSATWHTSVKQQEDVVVAWVQLSSTPEFVLYYEEETEEAALTKVALKCIKFLKIMTWKPKRQEAPTIPPEEEAAITPVKDDATTTALKEEVTATRLKEEVTATPLKEEVTATPLKEEVTATPLKEEVTATPLKEEVTVTPLKEVSRTTFQPEKGNLWE